MTTTEGDAGAVARLGARLAEIGAARGTYARLGPSHAALFVEASHEVLLVTFERLDLIALRDDEALPLGLALADLNGWSHLSLLATGETGWRDPRVWRQFDRLTDGAFFETYDRTVFYGSALGGYAAAAFSVAAPGATVLALAPRATLATDRAGWDTRHPTLRRADFTRRYGYAPDMIEAAGPSFILYDPWEHLDAVHASLFARPHVARLGWRGLGPEPEERLASMGLLAPMIEAACRGALDPLAAARLWRARRRHPGWQRALLARAEAGADPARALRLCRHLAGRAPQFRQRLQELEASAA